VVGVTFRVGRLGSPESLDVRYWKTHSFFLVKDLFQNIILII